MALRFLARRARTHAQLRAFLSRRGASRQSIDIILARFLKRGYVDDAAYAGQWARTRLSRQPMGRERLEAELLEKGISRTTVARTLDLIFAENTEEELARRQLAKRGASRKPKSRAQAADLLTRFGFAEEIIEKVMQEAFGD